MNTAGNNGGSLQSASSNRMTLDEARKVLWLPSRPKPIGDLLKEGYLDRSRLEWAAKKAYNPRLKEAAQVILDWRPRSSREQADIAKGRGTAPKAKPRLRVGISLDQARSTTWPFGAVSGRPMGELSETRQLTLKDLAYAAENARDGRVRHAAIALLLARLDQELEEPPPPAGMLRIVSPARSYGERRQLALAMLEGLVAGALLALSVGLVVSSLHRSGDSPRISMTIVDVIASPEGVLGLLLFLAIAVGAVWLVLFLQDRLFKHLDKRIENYRQGKEGEDRIVEKAVHSLDGNWALFRNVVLPGRRRTDLDIVLVGPPGVWAVEVKTLSGEYRNVGEAWQYRAGSRWKRVSKSPSRQASNGAIALKEFLRADGIATYIPAVVAWADQEGRVSIQDPTVPVWTLDRLEDELGNLWNGHSLKPADRERIVEKLTRVCLAGKKGPW